MLWLVILICWWTHRLMTGNSGRTESTGWYKKGIYWTPFQPAGLHTATQTRQSGDFIFFKWVRWIIEIQTYYQELCSHSKLLVDKKYFWNLLKGFYWLCNNKTIKLTTFINVRRHSGFLRICSRYCRLSDLVARHWHWIIVLSTWWNWTRKLCVVITKSTSHNP